MANAYVKCDQWSRGQLKWLSNCPVCGSSERVLAEFLRRDDGLVMPDVWRYVRCAVCYSIYLNPRPDADSLPRAYQQYFTHHAEPSEAEFKRSGLVAGLIGGYLNHRFNMRREPSLTLGAWLFSAAVPLRMKLDVYGRHLPKSMCGKGASLLDVGCGSGAFLERATEMGWHAEGCEPDGLAADACLEAGLKVLHGDAFDSRLDGRQFDAVTLNHVLEHVEDPLRLLKRLRQLLKSSGTLWMALPNPNAIGLRIFGKGWKGLHPPFHLLIPRQDILRHWLSQAGFNDIDFIRRGAQSPGLWRESTSLAKREGIQRARLTIGCIRLLGDLLSTVTTRYGEETIVRARVGSLE